MSASREVDHEPSARAWASSPGLAWIVRGVLFALPILAGWLAVRTVDQWFWRPSTGALLLAAWFAQAMVVGGAVATLVDRQTRRFLPLATLLGLSLTFPDQAPSRFGVALRAGTVRKLEQRIAEVTERGLADDESIAATQAIELITMLGKHERLTRGHTERVRAYADLIAVEMGVSDEERQKLAWAVLLHDIGKLTVPAEILNKQGKPTEAEWEILKAHPAAGEALVEPLADFLGSWRYATSQHHERWDGGGYPKGIAGERITLAGRITAVADAYDVITSKRSYKSPINHEAARRELVACSGTHFDPAVVRAFLAVSLEDQRSAGFLSGLLELPIFANIGASVSATPAIAALTVASVISAPSASAPATPLALEDPIEASVDVPVSVSTAVSSATVPDTQPTTATTFAVSAPSSVETTTTTAPSTTTPPTTAPTTTAPPTTAATTAPTTAAPPTTAPPTTAPTTTAPTTSAPPTTAPTTTAPPGPEANDDTATVEEGDDKNIRVLRNDESGPSGAAIDEDTLRIVTEPLLGTVRIHNDHVHYEAGDDEGIDSFTYEICDEDGACSTATVTVTIEDD